MMLRITGFSFAGIVLSAITAAANAAETCRSYFSLSDM
jgi:hypothetical protein